LPTSYCPLFNSILKRIIPHTLHHSYATHLLEKGVDIRYMEELLDQVKPETTMVYTHMSRRDLLSIRSPLDLIYELPTHPEYGGTDLGLPGEVSRDIRYN